jgi:hypothetical protein
MSIFVLNMLFAIAKLISVSALSSKMNRRLVWQKAVRNKHLPTYNASINLRTECLERNRWRGQNKKKKPQVHDSRCEFGTHRNWRRELVCVIASLFAPHDFYSKAACSNCKYTSIATGRDHYLLTFASFPTPIVSRFHFPLTCLCFLIRWAWCRCI